LHIVTRIRYLGFSHLKEEGSLDYDGGFVRLQIQMNFDTTINRQQAPAVQSSAIVVVSSGPEFTSSTLGILVRIISFENCLKWCKTSIFHCVSGDTTKKIAKLSF
jgi:hypothetical protein